MIAHAIDCCERPLQALDTRPDDTTTNWARIVNYLARKALSRRPGLPRDEVVSLAGLAVAMARSSFQPARSSCPIGVFACGWGWLRLRSLIRDELARRRRDRATCETDRTARRPAQPPLPALARDDRDAAWHLEPDWLARLDEEDRRLLRLRADGHTLQETAARLGRSDNHVRWRLRQIRAALGRLGLAPLQPAGRALPSPAASRSPA